MGNEKAVKDGNKAILEIGGVPSDKLAAACGTPLFVYDEAELEEKMQAYRDHFRSELFETEVIYASKAFTCKALLHKLKRFGFGVDVVSGGELYLAEQAGFPMERVYFHGNNKSEEELQMALTLGCRSIVVDSLMECRKLAELSDGMRKEAGVLIRINPGITAHTHKYIVTGNLDSKFGVTLREEDVVLEMVRLVESCRYLNFSGFHVHIGSQIFDLRAYDALIERMMKFIKKLETKHMIEVKNLDFGGGFGVRYTEEDNPSSVGEVCRRMIAKCEAELANNEISLQKIMIEPGRSIVAEAGYTLYRVGFLKDTPNKSYLFVDGGMTDNIRPALYGARYECDLANKMDQNKSKKYTVAGKCCESGDILIENAALPEAEPDDILVVYGTGAYGYSMANNYNRISKPAVAFVKDGKTRIVIKRETYRDQMHLETDEEVIV
ncbi:MAG TPA: diaminopimelate decarboxylase [Anaerovoracaceae bacterium]|nr:diaminopimelate decarboxylase [Anaerovoracaceae bacterium]